MKRAGPSPPAVTVVTSVYNKRDYVGLCLDSLGGQTCIDYELIVVDDASTDGGADVIIPRLRDGDRYIRLGQNSGPGVARNRGIREARGEFTAFLDADDAWKPSFVERMLAFMRDNPDLAMASCCSEVASTGLPWRPFDGLPAGRIDGKRESVTYDGFRGWRDLRAFVAYARPPAVVVRTEAARAVGGFEERRVHSEEEILWMRLALAHPVGCMREALALYRTDAVGQLSERWDPLDRAEILYPQEFLEACPARHRALLHGYLTDRAAEAAIDRIFKGHGAEAREILQDHMRAVGVHRDLIPAFRRILVASYLPHAAIVWYRSARKAIRQVRRRGPGGGQGR